jgi:type VI secretion system FHA domain protein
MALKLRVISDHYKQLGKQSSRLFGVTGGRIGRSADNDWILPDPERYVSSHHAEVRFEAGRWILEDVSTNGIFVNGSDTPLAQLGPCQLHDGDRLRLGDYDLLVSISDRNDFPADEEGQTPPMPVVKTKSKSMATQRAELEELNVEIDINDLLSGATEQPDTAVSDSIHIGNAFGLGISKKSATRPPAAPSNAAEKYEDIPLDIPVNVPVPPNVSRAAGVDWHLKTRRLQNDNKPAPRAADGLNELNAGLEAFCRGMGLDPASIGTDAQVTMLTLAGQMVREVVLGMMEVLKVRNEIKSRIDAGNASLQSMDNNPLKIATSVDDALRKLLDNQSSRYLGPVESLRESFAEIRSHQQAVVSAMHAALNSTMNRVDPGELQERFDRSLNRGALMGAANKLKYWDMYAEFFQVVNQRNGDGLPISFAEEFAQAYNEKLAGKPSRRR